MASIICQVKPENVICDLDSQYIHVKALSSYLVDIMTRKHLAQMKYEIDTYESYQKEVCELQTTINKACYKIFIITKKQGESFQYSELKTVQTKEEKYELINEIIKTVYDECTLITIAKESVCEMVCNAIIYKYFLKDIEMDIEKVYQDFIILSSVVDGLCRKHAKMIIANYE